MESGGRVFKGQRMRIIDRPELKKLSTLKLGGRGARLYLADSCSDLDELARVWPEIAKGSVFVLGRGSNVLFGDGELDLVLIKWTGRESVKILSENSEGEVFVDVPASLGLPRFLGWCIKKGLSGLEGLAGVPGSVGGAVAMNAGSHGVEIGSRLEKVKVWSPEQGVFWAGKEDMHITYRDFKFRVPGREKTQSFFIILGAIFRLGKDDSGVIKKRIATWYERKKNTQPVLQATAGCVFKNPPFSTIAQAQGSAPATNNISAGWLLDQAGLRGKQLGGVGFSALHANFLVNYGQGTSSQALELIELARDKVNKKWGITLEMEVKVVP